MRVKLMILCLVFVTMVFSPFNIVLAQSSGQIYLYGEEHGVERILIEELKLWDSYYHGENMRHLFVELPYYTGEFLNLWMQSETDQILDELFQDWVGTAIHNSHVKEFFQTIKKDYPETIFHGTDVGHQFNTTGERYLAYLKKQDLQDSEKYTLATEAILQGSLYYSNNDHIYRENKLVENFVRHFNSLEDESVMGIYGGAHLASSALTMTSQLKRIFGERIFAEDLGWLAKDISAVSLETIHLNGKDYRASYFGQQDLRGFNDFLSRDFWRVEDSYVDFKENEKTGDALPYNNYPMLIEIGQVFMIKYTKIDDTTMYLYYRSDGNYWNDQPTTEGFEL